MCRTTLFLLTLVTFLGTCGLAGDAPADRASLRGLRGVKIVVDPPGPELENQGLNALDLQTRMENRLHRAEIAPDQAAVEFLGLRLIAVRENKGAYAVCLALGLYQPVSLERDRTIKGVPETWSTESVVLVRPKQLSQAAAETVDQLVDQFIAAYRSVNLK